MLDDRRKTNKSLTVVHPKHLQLLISGWNVFIPFTRVVSRRNLAPNSTPSPASTLVILGRCWFVRGLEDKWHCWVVCDEFQSLHNAPAKGLSMMFIQPPSDEFHVGWKWDWSACQLVTSWPYVDQRNRRSTGTCSHLLHISIPYLVGSGANCFVVKRLAFRLGHVSQPWSDLVELPALQLQPFHAAAVCLVVFLVSLRALAFILSEFVLRQMDRLSKDQEFEWRAEDNIDRIRPSHRHAIMVPRLLYCWYRLCCLCLYRSLWPCWTIESACLDGLGNRAWEERVARTWQNRDRTGEWKKRLGSEQTQQYNLGWLTSALRTSAFKTHNVLVDELDWLRPHHIQMPDPMWSYFKGWPRPRRIRLGVGGFRLKRVCSPCCRSSSSREVWPGRDERRALGWNIRSA